MSARPSDPFASKAARDRAAELGLSPHEIDGTGKEGRITAADVERFAPPPPPEHLGEKGRELWGAVIRAMPSSHEFDPRELAGLTEASATADLIEQLQQALAADGLYIQGANRQRKQHPFLSEVRAQRLALVKMLATLDLPSGDEAQGGPGLKSERHQRAAHARWGSRGSRMHSGGQDQLLGLGDGR